MLNKNKYSKRTLSTFEIVGAYFVNYYVDDLYQHAKMANHKGEYSSITEAYKYHVKYFHQAFMGTPAAKSGKKSFHYYNRIVKALLIYYSEHSGHNTVKIVELIDRIVRELVPEEYFQDYNNNDKDRTMRTVLSNVITEFSDLILTKYLKLVIDQRSGWDLRPLQNEFLELILMEREKLFSAFIRASNPNVKKEKGSSVILDRMKATLRDQCQKTAEAQNKLAQAIKAIQTFKTQIEIRDAEIRDLREQVSSLQELIAEYARHTPTPTPIPTSTSTFHEIEQPPLPKYSEGFSDEADIAIPENEDYGTSPNPDTDSDDGLIGIDDDIDISLDL